MNPGILIFGAAFYLGGIAAAIAGDFSCAGFLALYGIGTMASGLPDVEIVHG